MNKKQFSLVFLTAVITTIFTQALITSALTNPVESAPAGASIEKNASLSDIENKIFEDIWKKTFHYTTFFESLDGFHVSGNASVDGNQLIFVTEDKENSTVKVSKTPSWQGLATFSQKSRFRTAFTMTNRNNVEAYLSIGGHEGKSYGFKIVNDKLYGYSNDGTKELAVLLQTITNDTYNVEARYKPNEVIVFYVNSKNRGELTKGFPSASQLPNHHLMEMSLKTNDSLQKSFQVSFFEYLQMRNVLK